MSVLYVRNKDGSISGLNTIKGEKGEPGVYILADGEALTDAPMDATVVVDPNGVPEVVGGGESPKLVAKYVHSGNKVIRPTALDLATGVFTCESHGLTTGENAIVVMDGCWGNVPYELISTSKQSNTSLKIRSIDADTFVLQNGSDDVVYPSELNTKIDLSKWHIEIAKTQMIIIEGFSAESLEIRFNGTYWGTSNYHLDITPFSDNNKIYTLFGQYDGRIACASNPTSICLSIQGVIRVDSCATVDALALVPKTSTSDYTYIRDYENLGFNRSTTNTTKTMRPLLPHEAINGIAIGAYVNNPKDFYGVILANGFTVEVYQYG